MQKPEEKQPCSNGKKTAMAELDRARNQRTTCQNSAANELKEAMTKTPNAQPTPCLMRRIHEMNKK
jgi:type II secretory pathway component PulM